MYFIKDGVLKQNFVSFIKVGLTKLCFIEVRFKKFYIKLRKEKTLLIENFEGRNADRLISEC